MLYTFQHFESKIRTTAVKLINNNYKLFFSTDQVQQRTSSSDALFFIASLFKELLELLPLIAIHIRLFCAYIGGMFHLFHIYFQISFT